MNLNISSNLHYCQMNQLPRDNHQRERNQNLLQNLKQKTIYLNIVKPAHAVTSIKQSPFSCPVIENFL